eukprot:scaffold213877_cov21-Tisochrysis_lutea.AAC.2
MRYLGGAIASSAVVVLALCLRPRGSSGTATPVFSASSCYLVPMRGGSYTETLLKAEGVPCVGTSAGLFISALAEQMID